LSGGVWAAPQSAHQGLTGEADTNRATGGAESADVRNNAGADADAPRHRNAPQRANDAMDSNH